MKLNESMLEKKRYPYVDPASKSADYDPEEYELVDSLAARAAAVNAAYHTLTGEPFENGEETKRIMELARKGEDENSDEYIDIIEDLRREILDYPDTKDLEKWNTVYNAFFDAPAIRTEACLVDQDDPGSDVKLCLKLRRRIDDDIPEGAKY